MGLFLIILVIVIIVAFIYVYKTSKTTVKNAAILLFDNNGKILLVKNRKTDKWQTPGGTIESTDPTPLSAAVREFREETDHQLKQYTVLYAYDYDGKITFVHHDDYDNFNGNQTRLFIIDSNDTIPDNANLVNNEMSERRWFDTKALPEMRQSDADSLSLIIKS